jgi:hypothetical protein
MSLRTSNSGIQTYKSDVTAWSAHIMHALDNQSSDSYLLGVFGMLVAYAAQR